MKRTNSILAILALIGALTGFGTAPARAQDSTPLGAGAGAAAGAGVGFALGGPVGALVGGLVGAGVGAGAGHAVGKHVDEDHQRAQAYRDAPPQPQSPGYYQPAPLPPAPNG